MIDELGGVVVGPILYASRAGNAPPRIAEMNGGFVRQVGQQNRGVVAVIRRFSKSWRRMDVRSLPRSQIREPERLGSVVEQLSDVSALSGLELLPPHDGGIELALHALASGARYSDLPVWVKLPVLMRLNGQWHSSMTNRPRFVGRATASRRNASGFGRYRCRTHLMIPRASIRGTNSFAARYTAR